MQCLSHDGEEEGNHARRSLSERDGSFKCESDGSTGYGGEIKSKGVCLSKHVRDSDRDAVISLVQVEGSDVEWRGAADLWLIVEAAPLAGDLSGGVTPQLRVHHTTPHRQTRGCGELDGDVIALPIQGSHPQKQGVVSRFKIQKI